MGRSGNRGRIIGHEMQIMLGLLPVVLTASFAAADPVEEPDLLAILTGEWRGQAVQTPVGPVPYDIRFVPAGENCISGTADNDFSNHNWTFCCEDGALLLDFLSDFRGNETPIHMRAVSVRENTVVFHADSHAYMDVILSLQEDSTTVEVRHHDEPHVRIEWRRPGGVR